MKKYKIPEKNRDLLRYVRNRRIKSLVGYAIYIAVFVAAYIFYINDERYMGISPLMTLIFALIVLISGFFIFRIGKLLCDRSFTGQIRTISFSRDYGRGMNRRASLSIDYHTYIIITTKNSKGRKKRILIPLFDDGYDGYYSEGDTVVYFGGSNYPLSLESERKGEHICAVCGVRRNDKEDKLPDIDRYFDAELGLYFCRCCGKSLINVEDLKELDE